MLKTRPTNRRSSARWPPGRGMNISRTWRRITWAACRSTLEEKRSVSDIISGGSSLPVPHHFRHDQLQACFQVFLSHLPFHRIFWIYPLPPCPYIQVLRLNIVRRPSSQENSFPIRRKKKSKLPFLRKKFPAVLWCGSFRWVWFSTCQGERSRNAKAQFRRRPSHAPNLVYQVRQLIQTSNLPVEPNAKLGAWDERSAAAVPKIQNGEKSELFFYAFRVRRRRRLNMQMALNHLIISQLLRASCLVLLLSLWGF